MEKKTGGSVLLSTFTLYIPTSWFMWFIFILLFLFLFFLLGFTVCLEFEHYIKMVRNYRRYKNLKEIYEAQTAAAQKVDVPEEKNGVESLLKLRTAVPEGDCQWEDEEKDSHFLVESSSTDREPYKHYSRGQQNNSREHSWEQNVCSASVSSCMHIKRMPSLVATKSDEVADKISVCYTNDVDLSSPLMSIACNHINYKSMETNDLLGADLIHDPLYGNKTMENTSFASPSSEALETLAKELNEEHVAPHLSHPVNYDGGLDTMEVNVCDFCGDTGHEHFPSTCRRCNNGAETMYKKEPEKEDHNKYIKATRIVKGSSFSIIPEKSKDLKIRLNINPNFSRTEIEGNKDESTSITGRASTCHADVMPLNKKRSLDMSAKSPRISSPYKESVMHRDSSSKELKTKKTKATNDLISGDQFSESSLKTTLPASLDKSNILQSQPHMRKGPPLQSKSFHHIYSKVKHKLFDECSEQRHSASGHNKKKTIFRTMCKSLSFDNARLSCPYGSHTKFKMPCFYKDLKRSTDANEKKSTSVANQCNPSVSSPMNTPGILVLKSDSKSEPSGQTCLPSFGSRGHHLEACHLQTNNFAEATDIPACEGSMYLKEEQHNTDDEGKLHVELHTEATDIPACEGTVYSKEDQQNTDDEGKLHVKLHTEAIDIPACEGSKYSKEEQHNTDDEGKLHVELHTEATSVTRENNSKVTLHIEPKSYGIYLPNFLPVGCAIPEKEYIWKGAFEMWRNEKLLGSCGGFQAHMSRFVSPKGIELVHKLPQRILVEEVPRLSTWPVQFLESHATEDNIAMFFFAKDHESYEQNYKTLVESMVRQDLVLRAKCDRVELLILSSNLLPEGSDRCNEMLFLWGMFRGRTVSCSEVPERDVNHVDSMNVKEESEQGQTVDLISHLEGSKRYSTEGWRVDEGPDHKRAKSCFSGMQKINDVVGTKFSEILFRMDRLGSSVTGQVLECDGSYGMLVPSAETLVPVTKREDEKEHEIPCLELSLGAPFLRSYNKLSTALSLSLCSAVPLEN